jgi:hypothetical protein
MLKGVSIKGVITVTAVLLLVSCKSKHSIREKYYQSQNVSKEIISTEKYNWLYKNVTDTLQGWISNNIQSVSYLTYSSWRLDSLICFNESKNKAVMCYEVQGINGTMDDLHFFYGVNIDDKWYYYEGPTVYLPREYYQSDTHTPLSFEKLHEIAMKEIFSGYLKKDKDGEWQINERFFDQVVPKSNEPVASGFGECFTCKSQEEYVMYIVRKNWQYRDTTKMAKPRAPI